MLSIFSSAFWPGQLGRKCERLRLGFSVVAQPLLPGMSLGPSVRMIELDGGFQTRLAARYFSQKELQVDLVINTMTPPSAVILPPNCLPGPDLFLCSVPITLVLVQLLIISCLN